MGVKRTIWVGCMLAGSSAAQALPAIDWFSANIFKRITILGTRQIGLHYSAVTGDQAAFSSLNNYGQGARTLTDFGQMTVSGQKVLGLFNFNLSFADDRYQDPTARRFSINYDKRGMKVDAGDIYASLLSGNQFLTFQRQLWGLSAGFSRGKMGFSMLESSIRSSATTLTLAGNNSPGPYYLQTSQLIADSVRVQVDGREYKYPDDFTINAIIGSFTFNTLSVPPTSTIAVSYEATGPNSGGGSIRGAGFTYDNGRWGKLGVQGLQQTDPGGGTLNTFVDRFQGFGDPSVPYILQYVPLASRPIVITVDGLLQNPGIDFSFSTSNPTVFYFLRYIPTTSTVIVTYTPSPTSSLRGDRTITGLDYTIPLGLKGHNGGISFSQASSHLSNAATPLSGTARGVTLEYKLKSWRFNGLFDDIPQSFVGIESTSFLRNEKSTSLGTEYKRGKYTLDFGGSNSSIATQSTDANGNTTFETNRTTRLDATAKYTLGQTATWSLDQQHLTSWGFSGNSRADISTMSLAKGFGRLNTHMDLGRTDGYGPISTGTTTTVGSVLLNTISLNGDYAASGGWVFGGRTSISQVSTAGTSGTGNDISASAAYVPNSGRMTFNTSYAYSNSGEIATLGTFQNGLGAGYNGNGFSGGYNGGSSAANASGFNSGGTNLRRLQSSLNWALSKRLNIGTNAYTSSQSGGISTNADTTGVGISTDLDIQNGQRIGLALDRSSTLFPDTLQSASSLSLDFSIGGKPRGPWSYKLGLGSLVSSGGSVAQNSLHYDANLRHLLKSNQAVIFDFSYGALSNYQPQSDYAASFGYEYQVFKNIAVVGRYQIRNVSNLDPTIAAGAYRFHGFDLEMNFNFGS